MVFMRSRKRRSPVASAMRAMVGGAMKRASHHDQLSSSDQPATGPGRGSAIMASRRATVASIITGSRSTR